jgi:hypothetical protein
VVLTPLAVNVVWPRTRVAAMPSEMLDVSYISTRLFKLSATNRRLFAWSSTMPRGLLRPVELTVMPEDVKVLWPMTLSGMRSAN